MLTHRRHISCSHLPRQPLPKCPLTMLDNPHDPANIFTAANHAPGIYVDIDKNEDCQEPQPWPSRSGYGYETLVPMFRLAKAAWIQSGHFSGGARCRRRFVGDEDVRCIKADDEMGKEHAWMGLCSLF